MACSTCLPCLQMAESCLIKLCQYINHTSTVCGSAWSAKPSNAGTNCHQAHTVWSQLIHFSKVRLPKHILSNSTRCLANHTCSLQTCFRNTTDLRNSAPWTMSACALPQFKYSFIGAGYRCEWHKSIFATSLNASWPVASMISGLCAKVARSVLNRCKQ